jgi:hypothetical protein
VAHDGRKAPIQLVDQKGCVVRPKIMSPFKKLKNFDATANVLSYAYFQVCRLSHVFFLTGIFFAMYVELLLNSLFF